MQRPRQQATRRPRPGSRSLLCSCPPGTLPPLPCYRAAGRRQGPRRQQGSGGSGGGAGGRLGVGLQRARRCGDGDIRHGPARGSVVKAPPRSREHGTRHGVAASKPGPRLAPPSFVDTPVGPRPAKQIAPAPSPLPATQPVEQPAEQPVEQPPQQPAPAPVAASAPQPAEQPAAAPISQPAEQLAAEPAPQPAEQPTRVVAQSVQPAAQPAAQAPAQQPELPALPARRPARPVGYGGYGAGGCPAKGSYGPRRWRSAADACITSASRLLASRAPGAGQQVPTAKLLASRKSSLWLTPRSPVHRPS